MLIEDNCFDAMPWGLRLSVGMAQSSKHDLDNTLLSQILQQMPCTTTISGTSTIEQSHGIHGRIADGLSNVVICAWQTPKWRLTWRKEPSPRSTRPCSGTEQCAPGVLVVRQVEVREV